MKKILAVVMAAMLLFTLALPAFAVTEIVGNVEAKKVVASIKAANKAPVLDGKVDAGEYSSEITKADADMCFNVSDPRTVAEAKAVSWKLYATYDANYVYIAAVEDVTADKYNCNFTQATSTNIWQQSALQVGISPASSITKPSPCTDFVELGFARNSVTGENFAHTWRDTVPASIKHDASNYKIDYKDNKLTYEVRIPWAWVQATPGKAGEKIGLCVVVARGIQKDPPASSVTHSSWAGGVTATAKDATFFATVTLEAAPVVTTTAAATTKAATGGTTAPKTADMSVIFVGIMLAAIATFAVVTKKNAVK